MLKMKLKDHGLVDKTLIQVAIDDFTPDFSKEEKQLNDLAKEGKLTDIRSSRKYRITT